ncbi:MAG: hypothetical protein RL745_95 [Actinomycetota bacterium]
MRYVTADSLAKYVSKAQDARVTQMRQRSNERQQEGLDQTSRAIIEQLQQDGRRSYAAIGQAVGLSEAAVRQRVQRLTETGVMQIVAVTDPMQIGFNRMALIGICVNGDLQHAAQTVEQLGAVSYVVMTAGQYDLLAEVVCEDDEQLLEVLSAIRSIADVTRTETFVYLKVRKQIYSWGTR